MMEGVSSEAASTAGHLKLSNLVWIYDSNHITIEGNDQPRVRRGRGTRFEGYGWNVLHVDDANDTAALAAALESGSPRASPTAPTLIIVHSIIGYGAPKKQGTKEAHGEPLGPDEVTAAKDASTAGPPTRSSWCPTACRSTSTRRHGRPAASNAPPRVDGCWRATVPNTRTSRPSST